MLGCAGTTPVPAVDRDAVSWYRLAVGLVEERSGWVRPSAHRKKGETR
jgi:hypothetical protein